MEFAVSLVPVPVALEQPLGLGSLARLHPLRDDVGEPALGDHFQDVLAIELSIHQHVIDVDEFLSRIQQLLDNLFPPLSFRYRADIKDEWDSVAD
jgi:hypothetical protein